MINLYTTKESVVLSAVITPAIDLDPQFFVSSERQGQYTIILPIKETVPHYLNLYPSFHDPIYPAATERWACVV